LQLGTSGYSAVEDPGDKPWPASSVDAGEVTKFAEARCDLNRQGAASNTVDLSIVAGGGSPDLGPWSQVSIVARLSRFEDRTQASQLQLLAEEGIPVLEVTTSPDGAPEILAYNDGPDGWASSADAGTSLRAERHEFRTERCPGGVPYHIYLVVSIRGTGAQDAAQAVTRYLMDTVQPLASRRAASIMSSHYAACAVADGSSSTDAPDGDASDQASTDADLSDGGLPLGKLPAILTTSYCTKVAACCTTTQIDPMLTDRASCGQQIGFSLSLLASAAQPALDGGAISYDPVMAASCVSAFGAASCSELATTLGQIPCLGVLKPLTPQGSTCTTSLSCIDSYCLFDPDGGASTDGGVAVGSCVAKKNDGETCTSGEECSSGYCEPTSQRCAQPAAISCSAPAK
jgi:hypothetical protein